MNMTGETREYFFSGRPVNLRITASPRSIQNIEFTDKASRNRHEFPPVVKQLFDWLENYSQKKAAPLRGIILLGNDDADSVHAQTDSIILDASVFTDKERAVYGELMKIMPGELTSYGELAARCSIPRGGRFIGNAMRKNRFPLIIPCHRVLKSDGTLGGFSGGLHIKEKLLAHEAGGFTPSSQASRKR